MSRLCSDDLRHCGYRVNETLWNARGWKSLPIGKAGRCVLLRPGNSDRAAGSVVLVSLAGSILPAMVRCIGVPEPFSSCIPSLLAKDGTGGGMPPAPRSFDHDTAIERWRQMKCGRASLCQRLARFRLHLTMISSHRREFNHLELARLARPLLLTSRVAHSVAKRPR
jgi:hypothetical protein